jgi:hypothetical protein
MVQAHYPSIVAACNLDRCLVALNIAELVERLDGVARLSGAADGRLGVWNGWAGVNRFASVEGDLLLRKPWTVCTGPAVTGTHAKANVFAPKPID